MKKLIKINGKNGIIFYRGIELKKFFLEAKKHNLTEIAKEVLNKFLHDVEYDLHKDIMFVSVSEYAYVKKGYCSGIHHRLKKAEDSIKDVKSFVEYLNNIQYRWDDSYLEVTIR